MITTYQIPLILKVWIIGLGVEFQVLGVKYQGFVAALQAFESQLLLCRLNLMRIAPSKGWWCECYIYTDILCAIYTPDSYADEP